MRMTESRRFGESFEIGGEEEVEVEVEGVGVVVVDDEVK